MIWTSEKPLYPIAFFIPLEARMPCEKSRAGILQYIKDIHTVLKPVVLYHSIRAGVCSVPLRRSIAELTAGGLVAEVVTDYDRDIDIAARAVQQVSKPNAERVTIAGSEYYLLLRRQSYLVAELNFEGQLVRVFPQNCHPSRY